jgi:ribosome-associated translation inhibitor RaiA
MAIVIEGLGDAALRRLVGKKLDGLLRHLRQPPVAVRVDLTDENGPKGGVGIRCALTVDMARRRTVHVEHTAATPRQAFDLAFEALERRALQEIDRARDRRRRPKKYFLAKRLLESGGGQPVEPPNRQRRSA